MNPTPRILCVDDDPEFHTVIELRLREFRVEVNHSFYGIQGISEASSSAPDLILMDYGMPYGSGEDVLDVIKRCPETQAIPVIVVTGMRSARVKRMLLKAGASSVLHKPVDFEVLMQQMARFIELQLRVNERGQ